MTKKAMLARLQRKRDRLLTKNRRATTKVLKSLALPRIASVEEIPDDAWDAALSMDGLPVEGSDAP